MVVELRFSPIVSVSVCVCVCKFIKDPREETTLLMELLRGINIPSIRVSYLPPSAMDVAKGQQELQEIPFLPAIKDCEISLEK